MKRSHLLVDWTWAWRFVGILHASPKGELLSSLLGVMWWLRHNFTIQTLVIATDPKGREAHFQDFAYVLVLKGFWPSAELLVQEEKKYSQATLAREAPAYHTIPYNEIIICHLIHNFFHKLSKRCPKKKKYILHCATEKIEIHKWWVSWFRPPTLKFENMLYRGSWWRMSPKNWEDFLKGEEN